MTEDEVRDLEREALIAEALRRTTDLDVTTNPPVTRAFIRRLAVALESAHRELLAVRKHPEPEWEYGAGYEADNGIEMRWFSMGAAAYTVREAAENEVARFDDPQIQLVRRTRPGPWVPVGEGEHPDV